MTLTKTFYHKGTALKCSKCGEIKQVTEFSVNRSTVNGYQSHCKACRHEYYVQHKQDINKKAADNYKKHREERIQAASEYYAEHREEKIEYAASYSAKYPDRVIGYKRKYAESENGKNNNTAIKHRRRVKCGSHLSAHVVAEAKAEYGGFCPYCNKKIINGHIDHIIPVINGGTNYRDNLVYVCAPCNMEKGSKSLLEFMIYRTVSAQC